MNTEPKNIIKGEFRDPMEIEIERDLERMLADFFPRPKKRSHKVHRNAPDKAEQLPLFPAKSG